MRHLAWLQAVPRPPKGSKLAEDFNRATALSRLDQLKKDRVAIAMPDNPAPHIIDRLVEMGLTEAAGMGSVPLSWREIEAWQRNTMVLLPPWEARLMRRLSVEYLAESRRAEEQTCPPPWLGTGEAAIKAEIAVLDAVLG